MNTQQVEFYELSVVLTPRHDPSLRMWIFQVRITVAWYCGISCMVHLVLIPVFTPAPLHRHHNRRCCIARTCYHRCEGWWKHPGGVPLVWVSSLWHKVVTFSFAQIDQLRWHLQLLRPNSQEKGIRKRIEQSHWQTRHPRHRRTNWEFAYTQSDHCRCNLWKLHWALQWVKSENETCVKLNDSNGEQIEKLNTRQIEFLKSQIK